jgi:hypothetical protein
MVQDGNADSQPASLKGGGKGKSREERGHVCQQWSLGAKE